MTFQTLYATITGLLHSIRVLIDRLFASPVLSEDSLADQSALQAVANEPIEAPKRKRGRPRKTPAPTKA